MSGFRINTEVRFKRGDPLWMVRRSSHVSLYATKHQAQEDRFSIHPTMCYLGWREATGFPIAGRSMKRVRLQFVADDEGPIRILRSYDDSFFYHLAHSGSERSILNEDFEKYVGAVLMPGWSVQGRLDIETLQLEKL